MAGTRERIITEAMRLFAERGYKGTTVAAIEEAAGLSPGSGGLYKHFRSKEQVLRAGVDAYLEHVDGLRDIAAATPATGLRDAGRAAMDEMATYRDYSRILFRELDQFPDLLSDIRDRSIHATYRSAAESMRRSGGEWGLPPDTDWEALAIVSLGPLLYYRIVELLFGEPPGKVPEDRVLDAWVDVWTTYLAAKAGDTERKQ